MPRDIKNEPPQDQSGRGVRVEQLGVSDNPLEFLHVPSFVARLSRERLAIFLNQLKKAWAVGTHTDGELPADSRERDFEEHFQLLNQLITDGSPLLDLYMQELISGDTARRQSQAALTRLSQSRGTLRQLREQIAEQAAGLLDLSPEPDLHDALYGGFDSRRVPDCEIDLTPLEPIASNDDFNQDLNRALGLFDTQSPLTMIASDAGTRIDLVATRYAADSNSRGKRAKSSIKHTPPPGNPIALAGGIRIVGSLDGAPADIYGGALPEWTKLVPDLPARAVLDAGSMVVRDRATGLRKEEFANLAGSFSPWVSAGRYLVTAWRSQETIPADKMDEDEGPRKVWVTRFIVEGKVDRIVKMGQREAFKRQFQKFDRETID